MKVRWPISGFAGHTTYAVLGRVTIELTDGMQTLRWPTAVAIVDYGAPHLEQQVILGHTGFLQYFDAEFRGADKLVLLEPNGALPAPK